MIDHNLTTQVDNLLSENRANKLARESVERNYQQLKERYDDLANEVEGIRNDCANRVREANTERDRAVTKASEVEALLNQAADLIMQAMRAAVGDKTSAIIPERKSTYISDSRLPTPSYEEPMMKRLALDIMDGPSHQDASRPD